MNFIAYTTLYLLTLYIWFFYKMHLPKNRTEKEHIFINKCTYKFRIHTILEYIFYSLRHNWVKLQSLCVALELQIKRYSKLSVCNEMQQTEELKIRFDKTCFHNSDHSVHISLWNHYQRVSVRRPSLQSHEQKKRKTPRAIFFYCHERPLVPNPG